MCWSIKQPGWRLSRGCFLPLLRTNSSNRLPKCRVCACWCRWGQRNALWIWNRKPWCLRWFAVESESVEQLGLFAPRVRLHIFLFFFSISEAGLRSSCCSVSTLPGKLDYRLLRWSHLQYGFVSRCTGTTGRWWTMQLFNLVLLPKEALE